MPENAKTGAASMRAPALLLGINLYRVSASLVKDFLYSVLSDSYY